MIPMPGRNISMMATMVVVEVSRLCTIFSVAQKNSSAIEISINFFSSARIGPRAANSLAMVSCPPLNSTCSAGIIRLST